MNTESITKIAEAINREQKVHVFLFDETGATLLRKVVGQSEVPVSIDRLGQARRTDARLLEADVLRALIAEQLAAGYQVFVERLKPVAGSEDTGFFESLPPEVIVLE